MLVCYGVDLRAARIFVVDDRVGKTVEVVHAKAELTMRATLWVLHDEVSNALELGDERLRDDQARVLG